MSNFIRAIIIGRLKSLTLTILLVLISIIGYTQKQIEYEKYEKILDNRVEEWMHLFNVPGSALAFIEEGEVVYMKGFGYSNKSAQIPIRTNTVFNIGSLSKVFTAWGVMVLVEKGLLKLSDSANKYLSHWKFPDSKFDSDKITIGDLLAHTAGLNVHGYAGYSDIRDLPSLMESLSGEDRTEEKVNLISDPGTKWRYSGGGYTVLQLIIEECTGKTFTDFMREELFLTLGMENSGYNPDFSNINTLSKEHDAFAAEIPYEHFTAKAAAGLFTSIEDLAKFAMASFDPSKGSEVLSKDSIDTLVNPTRLSKGRYGMGFQILNYNEPQLKLVGHGGANRGWHSYLMMDYNLKNGFIMLTNAASGYHLYNQVFCNWLKWRYQVQTGNECSVSLVPIIIKTYSEEGLMTALEVYNKGYQDEDSCNQLSPITLNRFGFALLGKGYMNDAIKVFKKNSQYFPLDLITLNLLGDAYFQASKYKKAKKTYKKVLSKDSQNEYAKEKIAALKEMKNK